MKTVHKPTSEEKRIIRQCAQKSAGFKGVEINPGVRFNIEDDSKNANRPDGLAADLNIAFISDDPEWSDTDLHDNAFTWSDFTKGIQLTEDGRAIVDFYVYNLGRHAELQTNVTAYWREGRMIAVEGTGDGVMWRAEGYTGNPRKA